MILNNKNYPLSDLHAGDCAEITEFKDDENRQNFMQRLYEVGFLVGETLEVMHEAPLSLDPMSIRIKDAVYAIRREDAELIQVSSVVRKSKTKA